MKARLVVLLLLSMSFSAIAILPETARATTLCVGGAGPGNYTTIQGAIDAASPGDTVFVFSGTYYENVVVNKTITLMGEDRDSTIVNASGSWDVIRVTADWTNITGLTVTESGVAPFMGEAGIELYAVDNCSVIDINASGNVNGIQLHNSDDNTISDSLVLQNHMGIYLYNSSGNLIAGSSAHYSNHSGISVVLSHNNTIVDNLAAGNHWGISASGPGNVLLNNTLSHNQGGISVGRGDMVVAFNNLVSNNISGIRILNASNTELLGNSISNSKYGIELDSTTDVHIANNTLVNAGITIWGNLEEWGSHEIETSNTVNGKPVRYLKNEIGGTVPEGAGQVILANCTGITVENQTIDNATIGIQLGYSSGTSIMGNTLLGNRLEGIAFWRSHNNTVGGNDVSMNNMGMYAYRSPDNSIANNMFLSNHHTAIEIDDSTGNEIVGNSIMSNGNDGIFLYFYSDGSVVEANEIVSNGDNGIAIYKSDWGTIRDNTVSGNMNYGIWNRLSNGNSIYSNRLIGNGEQAYDDGAMNLWDNGYPSGGNYWSDYAGADKYHGSNQLQPGSDGIGDLPYVIDADTRDRYPLMNPFPPSPPSAPLELAATTIFYEVRLTWSPPAFDGGSPILGYSVFRGNASGDEVLLAELGNVTSYNDRAVTNGRTYYYKVTAKNMMGEGPGSDELEVILTNRPPVCEIVSPSSGYYVSLTWVIRVDARDYDGPTLTVEIRIGNGSWMELERPWEYDWDTSEHPDGYVTIYARAHDGVNYSEVVNVTPYIRNERDFPHPPPFPYICLAVTFGPIFVYVMWVIIRRKKREDDEESESLLEDQNR
ncbi:MAG: right-handed parallel beta-helix repeat-containing protein [Candidatus Thermoplasmatota archaeon]|nr:right-handed parallel beta-helix repeat-containing protein [Candidatus Thermoplasmatota archaeon]